MRASVLNPLVKAFRAAPQNLLDFAFMQDKINPKQKDFANYEAERLACLQPADTLRIEIWISQKGDTHIPTRHKHQQQ